MTTDLLIVASSSDDGSGLPFLLLLAGPAFYVLMYLRYRNVDKRHHHESETKATMHDVRATDEYHRSLKGVSHSRMKGANNNRNGGLGGLARNLGIKLPD